MRTNEEICSNIPEEYRAHAIEIMDQLDFMREKLEISRKKMAESDLIYFTINTKGKKVPKRNPFFNEYNALMRTYNSTIDVMRELLSGNTVNVKNPQGNLIKFERRFRKAQ